MPQAISIAVVTESTELYVEAEVLAKKLALPFVTFASQDQYDYVLRLTPEHLEFQKIGDAAPGPIFADFLAGQLAYRRQHSSLRKEALARALGLKGNLKLQIVDATAGLGRDSFMLACLGCEVFMLERSPIIHALLEDALKRAIDDPMIKNLHLIQADAITWLQNLGEEKRPEVIYLDPMFPERSKTALVKKEMRIFREVLGDDTDTKELLRVALCCATRRVVVKRPRLAASLEGPEPTFKLTGKTSRFDIYLVTF